MSFDLHEADKEKLVIEVNSVSKHYDLDITATEKLKNLIIKRNKSSERIFSALKNISFTLKKGQTLGIIGRNGSGKSTLLEIISGVTQPTTGSIKTRGRIAALLQLGIGFNPVFTGRENVLFNAALLGLSKKEILSRFDEIEQFADIGQFIDQPVRTYSSGMYARLAFAVSIHVWPDILIIDEALAVGDEVFQRKCFAKIEEIKRKGATILFVSHSGAAIINLCDKVLLLHQGELIYDGEPKIGVYYLQKLGNAEPSEINGIIKEIREVKEEIVQESQTKDKPNNAHSSEQNQTSNSLKAFYDKTFISNTILSYEPKDAAILSAHLMTEEETIVNHVLNGSVYKFRVKFEFFKDCDGVRAYALIRTIDGIDLAGCVYPSLNGMGFPAHKGDRVVIDFKFKCMLNQGTYFCNFALQDNQGFLHHRIVDALAFKVMPDSSLNRTTGLVDLEYTPIFYHE